MDVKTRAKKAPGMKPEKRKQASTVLIAVMIGLCEGFLPCAYLLHSVSPWYYAIPLLPIVVYLIIRIVKDLKGWYEG